MQFVKLQTTYYLDPAVAGLTPVAELAFIRSIAYCGSAETHGYIADALLPHVIRRSDVRSLEKVCKELVTAALWIRAEGGYQLRTWYENQSELETLLTRRNNEAKRQRKHRQKAAEEKAGSPEMSRDTNVTVTPPEKRREEQNQTPIETLVCRRLFGDARATTTDENRRELWVEAAAPADLETELKAWLMFNSMRDLRDPAAALLGWLRTAAKRAAAPTANGCDQCIRGWTADEYGQPSEHRCPTCRPKLRSVEAS